MGFPQNTVGGWQCQSCGKWIDSNTTHVCPAGTTYIPPLLSTLQQFNDYADVLERIATALEQIATLMKNLSSSSNESERN